MFSGIFKKSPKALGARAQSQVRVVGLARLMFTCELFLGDEKKKKDMGDIPFSLSGRLVGTRRGLGQQRQSFREKHEGEGR